MGNLVQATTSFAIGLKDGSEDMVHLGEIFDEDHEYVRRTPDSWRPLNVRGQVEQATAAPGEERKSRTTKARGKSDAAEE